jgi:hypothetical protein
MDEIRSDAEVDTRGVRQRAARIEAFGWGLFFIWTGVAFLADVGWAAGIMGVGLIALGTQAARKASGLPVEWFGLAAGLAMTGWGAWSLSGLRGVAVDVPVAFLPVLLIALGIALVLRALVRRHSG